MSILINGSNMYTDGKLEYVYSTYIIHMWMWPGLFELSSLFGTHVDWLLLKINFPINGVLNVTTNITFSGSFYIKLQLNI